MSWDEKRSTSYNKLNHTKDPNGAQDDDKRHQTQLKNKLVSPSAGFDKFPRQWEDKIMGFQSPHIPMQSPFDVSNRSFVRANYMHSNSIQKIDESIIDFEKADQLPPSKDHSKELNGDPNQSGRRSSIQTANFNDPDIAYIESFEDKDDNSINSEEALWVPADFIKHDYLTCKNEDQGRLITQPQLMNFFGQHNTCDMPNYDPYRGMQMYPSVPFMNYPPTMSPIVHPQSKIVPLKVTKQRSDSKDKLKFSGHDFVPSYKRQKLDDEDGNEHVPENNQKEVRIS